MIIDGIEISGISNDSREVLPGYIFVAIKGTKLNGEEFIDQAISNGAKMVILYGPEEKIFDKNGIRYAASPNPRMMQAKYACRLFAEQPKKITAVTGTNGKTSVTEFARQILAGLGVKTATIGTLGTIISEYIPGEYLTSPDSIDLHKTLERLSMQGIDNLILEASSHALDQYRLSCVKISNGVWTNFSQDHLDYHGSMENYFNTKSKLLDMCDNAFIYNADDTFIRNFIENHKSHSQMLSFGINGKDLKITNFSPERNEAEFNFLGKNYKFTTKLPGLFQLYNIASAALIAHLHNASPDEIIDRIQYLHPVIGRMEKVGSYNNGYIYIDFAHTPDGLEKALIALNELPHRKILVIFGCGGDRDPSKRPLMGAIAERYSDTIILTDDNPRNEPPNRILGEIIRGLTGRAMCVVESDRASAIKIGISMLEPGDILLIAGKGHESYQIIGNQKIPFSDKKEILSFIGQMFHVEHS